MIDPSDTGPNQRHPSPNERLEAVAHFYPETTPIALEVDFAELMDRIFESGGNRISSMTAGTLVGGSPEAIEVVQTALLDKLEQGRNTNQDSTHPVVKLWPPMNNFLEPAPPILEAMQRRTDEIESLFLATELDAAIIGSYGRWLHFSSEIAHPEFKWVQVNADNHTYFGITYEFFKKRPATEATRPVCDMQSYIYLGYLNKIRAPLAVSEEYPYFIQSYYRQERRDNKFKEESALDAPKDLLPLLSSLAHSMVTEALVEQGVDRIEIDEKYRATLNKIAAKMIQDVVDPTEARDILKSFGIYDDPDEFRKVQF